MMLMCAGQCITNRWTCVQGIFMSSSSRPATHTIISPPASKPAATSLVNHLFYDNIHVELIIIIRPCIDLNKLLWRDSTEK